MTSPEITDAMVEARDAVCRILSTWCVGRDRDRDAIADEIVAALAQSAPVKGGE